MQRIFEYGDIQNITFTPDEERTPSYLIIYRSRTLLKMVRFLLAHPVLITLLTIFVTRYFCEGAKLRN